MESTIILTGHRWTITVQGYHSRKKVDIFESGTPEVSLWQGSIQIEYMCEIQWISDCHIEWHAATDDLEASFWRAITNNFRPAHTIMDPKDKSAIVDFIAPHMLKALRSKNTASPNLHQLSPQCYLPEIRKHLQTLAES